MGKEGMGMNFRFGKYKKIGDFFRAVYCWPDAGIKSVRFGAPPISPVTGLPKLQARRTLNLSIAFLVFLFFYKCIVGLFIALLWLVWSAVYWPCRLLIFLPIRFLIRKRKSPPPEQL